MRDPVVEALSRTLWHRSPLLATPGLWVGSHFRTLPFPLYPPASHQDTQTRATVSTVEAQAANTARVSNEKEALIEALSFHQPFINKCDDLTQHVTWTCP